MIYQVLKKGNNRFFNTTTHQFDYELEYAYYSFEEDSITEYSPDDIIEQDGELFSISGAGNTKSLLHSSRNYWRKIQPEFIKNDDCEYGEMIIIKRYDACFFVTEPQFNSISEIYNNRNKTREQEAQKIPLFVDSRLLEIAENLICILDEETFFTQIILKHLYLFSAASVECDLYDKYNLFYHLDTNGLKGKTKKQAELRNQFIKNTLLKADAYLTNFAKIIEDEKQVNEYVAKAIAWEAVRQKTISVYARQWENEYAGFLKNQYEPDKDEIPDYEESKSEYIRSILECDDINFTEAKGRLIYYFVSKELFEIYDIGKYFDECETLIKKVESEIKNDDIKNELLIKQVRKPIHYTIDEIDMMSGREFEEFISILFQKMGYTTRMTPATGDQGIDIIATKNNIRIGIQAKCYTNSVGNSAVQEATAGKGFYSCDKVMVITNNYFTSSATELAQANNVVLWDRDFLKIKISEAFKSNK